jgi:pimeloyl-ACP methyl ester carboxylesterase
VQLNVRRWGAAGGAPFVFWHALGPEASAEYFGEIAERLGTHGHEVLGFDGPGFGGSPRLAGPEDYRLAALAALLREQIEELGLERPVVAGHSWGGAIAVTYAAAYPEDVRALVLLDSGHIDYADLTDAEPGMPFEERLAAIKNGPNPRNAESRALAMNGLIDRVSPAWAVIAERRIPTLLLLATEPPHGDQNREHIGGFERSIPHAEVRWVEGATHGIVGTTGPGLGDELAAWLATA